MVAIETEGRGLPGLALLEPSDGERLRRLFFRLSRQTVYRRFMSPIARPEQARPDRLLDLDHRDREAVVAVVEGEIVGVARYGRQPASEAAEVAVVVADDWQRRGLATRMLRALADRAAAAGVREFTVSMLGENVAAARLLLRLRPGVRMAFGQGVVEARIPVRGPAAAPVPGERFGPPRDPPAG